MKARFPSYCSFFSCEENVAIHVVWVNNMDLVTFTEEILNGKLHFLCSVKIKALNIYHASFMWKTFLLEGYKIGDSKF